MIRFRPFLFLTVLLSAPAYRPEVDADQLGTAIGGSHDLPVGQEAVVVARAGEAQLPIVISPEASDPVRETAAELATYLQRITGAPFRIEAGTEAAGITLGTRAQFPDASLAEPLAFRHHYDGVEAFVIRTEPQRIRLIANTDLGVSHAAYRFLELLGCRWFFMTDTWEIMPHSPTLSFAFHEDRRPDIWARDIWFDRLAQRMEPGDPSAKELFERNTLPGWRANAVSPSSV